jgi:hypothetical protein
MKKLMLIMSISFLLLIATACGNKEVDGTGKGPADIPVEWVNAQIQGDEPKMLDLLDEKTKALDLEDKSRNKETVKHYKLTEWKANAEHYFYKIEYLDPTDNDRLSTEQMEVIKTDSGWKRTKYGDIYDFDKLVEDLKPEVLMELHDE